MWGKIWFVGITLYFVFFYPTLLLYLVGTTYLEEQRFQENWIIILVILLIFITPFLIDEIVISDLVWTKRVLSFMYWSSILITGFSVFVWYVTPSNPRLEPVTILLGFSTAVISYNRRKQREKSNSLSVETSQQS